MRAIVTLLALACLLAPAGAQTYWSDNFDSYPTGQLSPGTGGWFGWDNVNSALGDIVTTQARSAPNSLEISADDTVQPWVLNDSANYPRSCQWRLTGWWYIDGASFTSGSGDQYILIQNSYNHGGPYTWSLQLRADDGTGNLFDDHRPEVTTPVITDQWVEVRVDIDLDNDTLTTYYNGSQVSTGAYVVAGGPLEIANLDLFSPGPSSIAYFDDFSLVQVSTTEYQQNRINASLDIDGVQGGRCANAVTTKIAGSTATMNITSPLSGNMWDMAIVAAPAVPLTGGGLAAGTQIVNVDLVNPSLVFLNSGTSTPATMPFPGTFAIPFNVGSSALTASAQFFIADPAAAEGLSLSQTSQLEVLPCGTTENFDGLSQGSGVAPTGWTNPSGAAVAWSVDASGTPSLNTGPTAASSSPNYMYCETSSPNSSANFVMDTCNISLSSLSTFTLNFDLSRIGSSVGTLNIWMDDDGAGTFGTLLQTYTGPDPTQSQGGVEWSAESITFVPGGTQTVGFRFDYTAGGSFTGDVAIDNFDVQ